MDKVHFRSINTANNHLLDIANDNDNPYDSYNDLLFNSNTDVELRNLIVKEPNDYRAQRLILDLYYCQSNNRRSADYDSVSVSDTDTDTESSNENDNYNNNFHTDLKNGFNRRPGVRKSFILAYLAAQTKVKSFLFC